MGQEIEAKRCEEMAAPIRKHLLEVRREAQNKVEREHLA
jgi:hypothetical protein